MSHILIDMMHSCREATAAKCVLMSSTTCTEKYHFYWLHSVSSRPITFLFFILSVLFGYRYNSSVPIQITLIIFLEEVDAANTGNKKVIIGCNLMLNITNQHKTI